MKTCSNCSAENLPTAKFCNECGSPLPAGKPKADTIREGGGKRLTASDMASRLKAQAAKLESRRQADVLFVLDVTGSMGGEIEAIKDAIIDFAHSIEKDGVRVRVGMLAFRDLFYNEPPELLTFGGEVFTSDAGAFSQAVGSLRATGGGDEPESCLDALMLALDQPFGEGRQKVIVFITDAPPHIPDKHTKSMEEVVAKVQEVGVEQIYLVIRTQDKRSQVYLSLLSVSRGLAFELGHGDDFKTRAEHFKRTLINLGKTISMATR